ncbi:amino acid permease [Candidatus Haliotispira prima]|uniref:Amino acid permease n=1 Tax=Candidatus Haliotispira prima TaxID=3034016 RepID=A0ABY8MHX8_9SPIO|nr:amino acid permease [Candidatus Haliotispira prima]
MKKHIGLGGVFSIATGAMISSGIFILPGLAFAQLGPAVSLAYLIAGLFAFVGCFSIIELATAMPKDGGDYYYIHKTFGGLIGSISGIFGWFALSLKSAFAIFGISEILFRFFAIWPSVSGVLLCLIFVLLNTFGAKEAMLLQNLLVFFLLVLLLLYSSFGIVRGLELNRDSPVLGLWSSVKEGFQFENLSSGDKLLTLLSISGFIFVSFGGLLKVTGISGEIANPKRNLPLGMSLSIIVITIFYTVINIILVAVMPAETLAASLAPVADSTRSIMQNWGKTAVNIAYYGVLLASLLAFITTANAGIMAASRYPMALSRDKLLPGWVGKVHPRYQTPVPALILTALIIVIALFLPLMTLVKAASAVVLSSYILTNLALIIFRESRMTNYRPSFSAPFYPWLQIFSILVFSFFIIDIGLQAIEVSIFFLVFSIAIYYWYGRKHGSRSFALVYLLRRIIDRHLDRNNLEEELLDVLLHRDEVKLNTFQELAKKATIQDFPYAMTFANMLKAGSKDLAADAGMEPELLEEQFLLRQSEGTTAFSPFLAIPHFITVHEQALFMQIVRCKAGIYFDGEHPSVKAIFLLGGGLQERRKHLECLAAIARIAEEKPDFEERWLSAKNTSELRNILLLFDSQ